MTGEAVHPWQQQQWAQLVRNRAAQRLPHALLVAGPAGTGLRAFAETWMQSLLCLAAIETAPCGECRGCRLYTAGTHPDALTIEPAEAGKAISIEAIRGLNERLSLTGSETSKLALIDPAEALTTAAANSVLKTLEEPAGGAQIILVSRRIARLPATIRSRCQRVAFGLPDTETAVAWLEGQGVDHAREWLSRAGGAPVLAHRYANEADAEAGHTEAVLETLLETLEQGRVPSSAHAAGRFPLTASVPIMTAAIEDLLRLAHAPGATHVRWPDQRARMAALAQRLDARALFEYLDALYRSIPGASSSLRADTQFPGLIADAAVIGAGGPGQTRG